MSPDVPTTADEAPGVGSWPLFLVAATAFVIGAVETLVRLTFRATMSLESVVESGNIGKVVSAGTTLARLLQSCIAVLVMAMQTSRGCADTCDTPDLMLLAGSGLFLTVGACFGMAEINAPGVAMVLADGATGWFAHGALVH